MWKQVLSERVAATYMLVDSESVHLAPGDCSDTIRNAKLLRARVVGNDYSRATCTCVGLAFGTC